MLTHEAAPRKFTGWRVFALRAALPDAGRAPYFTKSCKSDALNYVFLLFTALMAQPLDNFPEVFLSRDDLSSAVSRAVAAGELRQLGPRLYTKNLTNAPEIIIRRNAWLIVAAYAPGALIADRTALENRPAEDGSVFIVAARRRDIELPGLWIRPRSGPAPMEDDRAFIGGLRLSSPGRAYLDNMAPSRKRGGVSRTLGREELELRLDDIISRRGVEALNQVRDEARRIAPLIGRDEEFAAFDKLVGALLGTRDDNLVSDRARARRTGAPFDPDRIALFEHLHQELQNTALPSRPVAARSGEANSSLTFFEAYFSNFIEGTEFEVAEAADIVFNNVIPADRPEDAHDVLGTWRIVSARARDLYDVPDFRSASLRRRQWAHRPDHDERRACRRGRRADHHSDDLPKQLSPGVEGPLAEPPSSPARAHARLRAEMGCRHSLVRPETLPGGADAHQCLHGSDGRRRFRYPAQNSANL